MVPIEQSRYEADDIIATYARQARQGGAEVLIVSADKDLMQLVEPGVSMYDPASGQAGVAGSREERRFGPEEVGEYFGVGPDRVVDVQALAGNSTDNVPGAPASGSRPRRSSSPNMAISRRCSRAPARSSSRSGAKR